MSKTCLTCAHAHPYPFQKALCACSPNRVPAPVWAANPGCYGVHTHNGKSGRLMLPGEGAACDAWKKKP